MSEISTAKQHHNLDLGFESSNIQSFYLIYGLKGLDQWINGLWLKFEREQERSNGVKQTHLRLKYHIEEGFLGLRLRFRERKQWSLLDTSAADRVSKRARTWRQSGLWLNEKIAKCCFLYYYTICLKKCLKLIITSGAAPKLRLKIIYTMKLIGILYIM